MRLRSKASLPGLGRGLFYAAAIGLVLSAGACGKRGPLQDPQITTGVDEEGNDIKRPAPPPDYTKPFILDPLLF